VKTVRGGAAEMEKYFPYYRATHYGGRIVNPITKQITEIKE
jgi:hypothetical protein